MTRLTTEGAAGLSHVLGRLPGLKKLDLSCNNALGQAGMEVRGS